MLLGATLPGLAGDEIQVYTVPKEHAEAQLPPSQPAAGSPDIPVNAAPIHWTLPGGWMQKPADGIRLGSFAINGANGGKAEVAITSFPGSVGTELDNVNRWRRELSLGPVEANDLASEAVTVDSFQGKLYDIASTSSRTVVAAIPRDGSTWFIKLRGDSATVDSAKATFLGFLKSIHFEANGGQTASVAVAPDAGDPHAGLGLQGLSNPHQSAAATESPSDGPKWNAPPQWVQTGPRPMVFDSFSVPGDAGLKAEVTISSLQGGGGGLLANANRWRGQIGLGPIESDQLDGLAETLTTADGKATLVDFMGTDPKTGQPARLVAAIVSHGDSTWFYKLMGNGKLVGGQKDNFVQFVKSVHYP